MTLVHFLPASTNSSVSGTSGFATSATQSSSQLESTSSFNQSRTSPTTAGGSSSFEVRSFGVAQPALAHVREEGASIEVSEVTVSGAFGPPTPRSQSLAL